MCGGKSMSCGCFGMPETESNDCCGAPPPPPCIPKCGRPPPCCKKGASRSCKEKIVCYMPRPVTCKCAQERALYLQCVKFPKTPGCMPMTCEPLPDCPNKFICRPVEPQCRRTRACKQAPSPMPRPVSISCRTNFPPPPRAPSCPPSNPVLKTGPPSSKCEPNHFCEEFNRKCDK